jgi:hypothetical protein
MDLKNHNLEELWDFICSNIGFDENGKETQDAIRLFVKLKLKDQLKETRKNVGLLRQWLNERNSNDLITDEQIIEFLELNNLK